MVTLGTRHNHIPVSQKDFCDGSFHSMVWHFYLFNKSKDNCLQIFPCNLILLFQKSEYFIWIITKKYNFIESFLKSKITMYVKKALLIYVVEDNQIYNRMVCDYLKKQNYTNVKSFISGNECIKTVMNGESPDIVILDYFLDDLNGIDVLKAIKAKCKSAEYIFLTSNENIEVAIECIAYGVHDYIIKDKGDILKRLVDKLNKVSRVIILRRKNETIRLAIIITIFILSVIIISGFLLFAFGVIVRG